MGDMGIISVRRDVIDKFKVIMSETLMDSNQLMEYFFHLYNSYVVNIQSEPTDCQALKTEFLNQDFFSNNEENGDVRRQSSRRSKPNPKYIENDTVTSTLDTKNGKNEDQPSKQKIAEEGEVHPKHKQTDETQIKFRTLKSLLDKTVEFRVYDTTAAGHSESQIEDQEIRCDGNQSKTRQEDGTRSHDARLIIGSQSSPGSSKTSKCIGTKGTQGKGDGICRNKNDINVQKVATRTVQIQVTEKENVKGLLRKKIKNPVIQKVTKALQTQFEEETPTKNVVVTSDKGCQIKIIKHSPGQISASNRKDQWYVLADTINRVNLSTSVSDVNGCHGSLSKDVVSGKIMKGKIILQKADIRKTELKTDGKNLQQNACKNYLQESTEADNDFEPDEGCSEIASDGEYGLDDNDQDSGRFITSSNADSKDYTSGINLDPQNGAGNSAGSTIVADQEMSGNRKELIKLSVSSENLETAQNLNMPKKLPSDYYYCRYCTQRINSESSLFYHEYYSCKKVDKSFKCASCGIGFPEKSILTEHRCSLDPEKPLVCRICSQSFRKMTTLVNHQAIHTGEKKYRCDKCDFRTAWITDLKIHKASAHREPDNPAVYKCPECPYSSHSIFSLRKHQRARKHGKLDTLRCKTCSFEANDFSDLKIHMKIHKPLKRKRNRKTTTLKIIFKKDTEKVLPEVDIEDNGDDGNRCPYCSKQVDDKWSMFYHKLYSCKNMEKTFKCVTCELGFQEESSLASHKCSSNPDKPYTCHRCGKSFGNVYRVVNHQVTHSGEKKYRCDKCEYKTAWYSELNRHKKYRHTDQNIPQTLYKCSECSYSSCSLINLRKHQRVMKHGILDTHICKTCGQVEKDYPSLRTHMKKHRTIHHVLGKRQLEYLKRRGVLGQNSAEEEKMSALELQNILNSNGQNPPEENADNLEDGDCGNAKAEVADFVDARTSNSEADQGAISDVALSRESVGEVVISKNILKELADMENDESRNGIRNLAQCYICDAVLSDEKQVRRHIRRTHKISEIPLGPLSCPHCGQRLATKKALSLHVDYQCKLLGKPYRCLHCGLACTRESVLSSHKCTKDPSKPFPCGRSGCTATFASAKHVVNHHRCVHTIGKLGKKLKCDHCDYRSVYSSDLVKHKQIKHAEKRPIYRCNECYYATHVRHYLKKHLKTHGMTSCMCEWCGKIFGTTLSLEEHHAEEHIEPPEDEQCKICEFKAKNNHILKDHKAIHKQLDLVNTASKIIYKNGSKKPRIRCLECNAELSCLRTFRIHAKSFHKSQKVVNSAVERNRCSYCSHSMTSEHALGVHQYYGCLKIGRSFKCSICGLGFPDETVLAEHPCSQNPSKPYQCSLCDNSFTQVFKLIRHNFLHKGEKIYKCDQCTYETAWRNQLTNHLTMNHVPVEDRPVLRCTECDYFTHIKRNLRKHKLVHKSNLFTCDVCGIDFRTRKAFDRHDCSDHINSVKKTFKCDICDYKATTKKSMKKHLDKHSKSADPHSDLEGNRAKMCVSPHNSSIQNTETRVSMASENLDLAVENLNPTSEIVDAVNNIASEVEVVGTSASVVDYHNESRGMNISDVLLSPERRHQHSSVLSTLSRSQLDDIVFLVSYGDSDNEKCNF